MLSPDAGLLNWVQGGRACVRESERLLRRCDRVTVGFMARDILLQRQSVMARE